MEKKKIGIGIEFFDTIVESNSYYVDKTLLIKEILDNTTPVMLITRPRRFGKTLNMSMLKCFFEKGFEKGAKLFEGTAIYNEGEKYMRHQGKYPLIFLTLKDVRGNNFESAYGMLKFALQEEFSQNKGNINAIDEEEAKVYERVLKGEAGEGEMKNSLKFLIRCIYKSTGIKPLVLIDEYDVPLQAAKYGGYYDEMIDFMRSFLSAALKTNDALGKTVLTGCLRVSKESLFTGFNNLDLYSVDENELSQYFGFTQSEVNAMAEYYGCSDSLQELKKWYNGYIFGKTEIYNPWSIIKCIKAIESGQPFPYRPYWINTSENSIIRELIEKSTQGIKRDIERLASGESIVKYVDSAVTYRDMNVEDETIWGFLLHTGYLKSVAVRQDPLGYIHELVIPNEEVALIYRSEIMSWVRESVKKENKSELVRYIKEGDTEGIERVINKWLKNSISYHDEKESFYHGFMVGLLSSADEEFNVTSNREYGDGRPDIFLSIGGNTAVIIEIKYAKTKNELSVKCHEALNQIEEKNYAGGLKDEYESILKLGIAFCSKICKVKKAPR